MGRGGREHIGKELRNGKVSDHLYRTGRKGKSEQRKKMGDPRGYICVRERQGQRGGKELIESFLLKSTPVNK